MEPFLKDISRKSFYVQLTGAAKKRCVVSIIAIWALCSAPSTVVVEGVSTRFREDATVRTSEIRVALTASLFTSLLKTCSTIQAGIGLTEGEIRFTLWATKARGTFTNCFDTKSFETSSTILACLFLTEWKVSLTCSSSKTFMTTAVGAISKSLNACSIVVASVWCTKIQIYTAVWVSESNFTRTCCLDTRSFVASPPV